MCCISVLISWAPLLEGNIAIVLNKLDYASVGTVARFGITVLDALMLRNGTDALYNRLGGEHHER